MGIHKTSPYFISCDVCALFLRLKAPDPNHACLVPTRYPTAAAAKHAARAAGWTVGRDLIACPKCSPIIPT